MARLIDEFFQEPCASPLYWLYNDHKPPDRGVLRASDAEEITAVERFQIYRENAAKLPVIVADNVTSFLFDVKIPPDAKITDLATVAPPYPRCYVETYRPDFPPGDPRKTLIPAKWGWIFDLLSCEELARLVTSHCLPKPADFAHERVVSGLVGHLAFTVAAGGSYGIIAPSISVAIPLDAAGRPVSDPWGFHVFPHEQEKVGNPEYISAFTVMTLYPACLALMLLQHPAVTTKRVEHSPKLARARARHKKPPLANYETMDIRPAVEELRFTGQAGVVGLKQAIETCRSQFVAPSLVSADEPKITTEPVPKFLPGDF